MFFFRKSVDTILVTHSIDTIVLSSSFDQEMQDDRFVASLFDLLDRLEGKRIIVIGPAPRAPFHVGECISKNKIISAGNSCNFEVSSTHLEKIATLERLFGGNATISFIDITEFVCPSLYCVTAIDDDDAMYVDSGHLSVSGAGIVFAKIRHSIE